MTKNVRTRFAPSPTGFQHVGGFRTAMYAWLLARHHGGQFILRVEDTDQERRVSGAIKYIVEAMEWLGLDYDEGPSLEILEKLDESWEGAPDIGGDYGPYVQSQRLELYQKEAEHLISTGKAYRCDCTPEMLKKERDEQMARKETPGYSGYCRTRNVPADKPHVIRFRLPDKINLTIQDAVRGRVSWDNPPLRDPVILKADGYPTYHLACVVDDHHMKISHVLRGEEWLPTTPIHVLLYEAFAWKQPVFAHLSHILGPDGKKLSKRHGAVSVTEYTDQGILADALLNFVALIGWSPGEGEEQEIFSKSELIERFSLEGLNASGGVFDPNKLSWMNGVYIRNMSIDEFNLYASQLIKNTGVNFDEKAWNIVAPHVQERVKSLNEIAPMVEFLFQDKIKREFDGVIKGPVDNEKAKEIFSKAKEKLSTLEDFSVENIDSNLKSIVDDLGLKMGQVLVPIRIAVTGKKATPPLSESILALGKDRTLARLDEAIAEV